jgi:hypothetical protein
LFHPEEPEKCNETLYVIANTIMSLKWLFSKYKAWAVNIPLKHFIEKKLNRFYHLIILRSYNPTQQN